MNSIQWLIVAHMSLSFLLTNPCLCTPWFRPPAVPLIVQDPYISLWSRYDNLFDGPVSHWTGDALEITGILVVDGTCYRWMGIDNFNQCNNTVTQVKQFYINCKS